MSFVFELLSLRILINSKNLCRH